MPSGKRRRNAVKTAAREQVVVAKAGCVDGFTGVPVPPGTLLAVREDAKYFGRTGRVLWVRPLKNRRRLMAVRDTYVEPRDNPSAV